MKITDNKKRNKEFQKKKNKIINTYKKSIYNEKKKLLSLQRKYNNNIIKATRELKIIGRYHLSGEIGIYHDKYNIKKLSINKIIRNKILKIQEKMNYNKKTTDDKIFKIKSMYKKKLKKYINEMKILNIKYQRALISYKEKLKKNKERFKIRINIKYDQIRKYKNYYKSKNIIIKKKYNSKAKRLIKKKLKNIKSLTMQYFKINKLDNKAYRRLYSKLNPSKKRLWNLRYKEINRNKVNKQSREYMRKRKKLGKNGKINVNYKKRLKWIKANKEKIKEYRKIWRTKNKDRIRNWNIKQRQNKQKYEKYRRNK